MSAFIIRRILQMIPTLFGVMLLVFTLFTLVGGDPSLVLAGKHLTPDVLANIRAQLGLDQSLPQQFWIFVKQVLTLDFGTSWSTQQPVADIIGSRVGPSLTLTGAMLVVDLLIAIPLAALVAYFRGGLTDHIVTIACTVAMSVSALVYIIAGQYFLAFKMGWFPVRGWGDSFWVNLFVYVPLPLLMGLMVSLGPDIRFYRSFFVEEIGQDYVRTARAKGLSERAVMLKHVLRNALIPVVTSVMMSLPYMLIGALVLESFFGIPGMGNEVVMAVNKSDFPVIKAITIYIAIATMVFNLLGDLVYKLIDPRVQLT
ncbi:peptide/nickel transport system permease protein [Chromobacterium alkanivorans]|uniref:ABC transporter permease n=1 Tax=Chromobacterium TaxID=535 RepID=UPI0006542D53|nr:MULTISPECIES: ABC transporter permease [Chromobacterium]KMN76458.1 peptide ABC transporter permease [Chromobacterium sp. LK11]MBN3006793.1 ABC transporter permease [Chromobacterium alkanivorans]MCS3806990.1 peptide/nickel transport system permease protein [Chromobacterium alkanivorans]MCS3821311.1 peptide/nickel transport system permease protein [Chromobacterium alkanivorans]MCS3876352.1 peptide/nickel transport system permease protein [Chromobacterium alkanivorans]